MDEDVYVNVKDVFACTKIQDKKETQDDSRFQPSSSPHFRETALKSTETAQPRTLLLHQHPIVTREIWWDRQKTRQPQKKAQSLAKIGLGQLQQPVDCCQLSCFRVSLGAPRSEGRTWQIRFFEMMDLPS